MEEDVQTEEKESENHLGILYNLFYTENNC